MDAERSQKKSEDLRGSETERNTAVAAVERRADSQRRSERAVGRPEERTTHTQTGREQAKRRAQWASRGPEACSRLYRPVGAVAVSVQHWGVECQPSTQLERGESGQAAKSAGGARVRE